MFGIRAKKKAKNADSCDGTCDSCSKCVEKKNEPSDPLKVVMNYIDRQRSERSSTRESARRVQEATYALKKA